MVTICQQTGTITGNNSLLCNKLVRIYDIRSGYDTIDVLIEGGISPQVSTDGNSFAIGNEMYRIILVSKNAYAGTAIVQLTISTIEIPPPPPGIVATHYLDIYVKQYSWYTPGGAADRIIGKLADIDGALVNLFSSVGVVDYQYIKTDILANQPAGMVTIRINLRKTGLEGMITPLLAAILSIILKLGIIIIFVGVFTGWKFTLAGFIEQIYGKKYPIIEVIGIVDDVKDAQLDECNKNYTDPNAASGCQKAVICGAANGVSDALDITGADCDSLGTNQKVNDCLSQYNIDHDKAKYDACIVSISKDATQEAKDKAPKETDWETILLYGGIGIVGIIILTRR